MFAFACARSSSQTAFGQPYKKEAAKNYEEEAAQGRADHRGHETASRENRHTGSPISRLCAVLNHRMHLKSSSRTGLCYPGCCALPARHFVQNPPFIFRACLLPLLAGGGKVAKEVGPYSLGLFYPHHHLLA